MAGKKQKKQKHNSKNSSTHSDANSQQSSSQAELKEDSRCLSKGKVKTSSCETKGTQDVVRHKENMVNHGDNNNKGHSIDHNKNAEHCLMCHIKSDLNDIVDMQDYSSVSRRVAVIHKVIIQKAKHVLVLKLNIYPENLKMIVSIINTSYPDLDLKMETAEFTCHADSIDELRYEVLNPHGVGIGIIIKADRMERDTIRYLGVFIKDGQYTRRRRMAREMEFWQSLELICCEELTRIAVNSPEESNSQVTTSEASNSLVNIPEASISQATIFVPEDSLVIQVDESQIEYLTQIATCYTKYEKDQYEKKRRLRIENKLKAARRKTAAPTIVSPASILDEDVIGKERMNKKIKHICSYCLKAHKEPQSENHIADATTNEDLHSFDESNGAQTEEKGLISYRETSKNINSFVLNVKNKTKDKPKIQIRHHLFFKKDKLKGSNPEHSSESNQENCNQNTGEKKKQVQFDKFVIKHLYSLELLGNDTKIIMDLQEEDEEPVEQECNLVIYNTWPTWSVRKWRKQQRKIADEELQINKLKNDEMKTTGHKSRVIHMPGVGPFRGLMIPEFAFMDFSRVSCPESPKSKKKKKLIELSEMIEPHPPKGKCEKEWHTPEDSDRDQKVPRNSPTECSRTDYEDDTDEVTNWFSEWKQESDPYDVFVNFNC